MMIDGGRGAALRGWACFYRNGKNKVEAGTPDSVSICVDEESEDHGRAVSGIANAVRAPPSKGPDEPVHGQLAHGSLLPLL